MNGKRIEAENKLHLIPRWELLLQFRRNQSTISLSRFSFSFFDSIFVSILCCFNELLIISLCWINWVWNRIAEAKMWTSAFTKERSSLLSTLPPNGIPFPLFCFCFGLLITSFLSWFRFLLLFWRLEQWLYEFELYPVDWSLQQIQG